MGRMSWKPGNLPGFDLIDEPLSRKRSHMFLALANMASILSRVEAFLGRGTHLLRRNVPVGQVL